MVLGYRQWRSMLITEHLLFAQGPCLYLAAITLRERFCLYSTLSTFKMTCLANDEASFKIRPWVYAVISLVKIIKNQEPRKWICDLEFTSQS